MRYSVLLLTLCAVAVSATPLKARDGQDVESGLGMYDGSTTTIEKHPYLVRIYGDGYFWCAGSIVSESWIVTSAICTTLADNISSKLKVVAGTNGTSGGTTYAVSQIVQHPDFKRSNYDYSYSCVQVDGTFTWGETMQPLLLPSANPSTGTYYTVAGWGAVDADSDTYDTLREGTMKWINQLSCTISYALYGWYITERSGCAINKGKTTLCTGDIGDPFVLDGVYYGHFILANPYGDICTSTARSVLVAKIYPAAEWIKTTTGATSV